MALTVFVVLWLLAVAATFVPVLPASLLVWLSALVYALLTGFQPIGWGWLIGLGLVTLLAMTVDNVAALWGAKRFGASTAAMWGAVIGGILGLFVMPIGIIAGPLAGAVLAELWSGRPAAQAWRSGVGTLAGFLAGIGAKVFLHLLMGVAVLWRIWTAG